MHEKPHFMALPKTGLITNQYGRTPILPDNFRSSLLPLRNVLWCARQRQFKALRKLGFIVVQHAYKLRLAKYVLSKFQISNLNKLF